MVVRRYHDLVCWRLANELKLKVYAFTATEPAVRDFKYCSQIRDSARSGPANISEGFGRFRPAEFARFLEFARASLIETQNHLGDGRDLRYLPDSLYTDVYALADRAIGATTNLLKYLRSSSSNRRRKKNPEP
jgi:four helix bundle protein